uniref:Uncharacterized protein n=1 Tax=Anguilla anguilla TaxID=7936 RepID=A0A0E9SA58_ANGAN
MGTILNQQVRIMSQSHDYGLSGISHGDWVQYVTSCPINARSHLGFSLFAARLGPGGLAPQHSL